MASTSLALASLLRPLPDGWTLRPRRPQDIPAVVGLMEQVYREPDSPEGVWPERLLHRHLECFPEGQLVIESAQGQIVADSTTLRVAAETALSPHRWAELTDEGSLSTHRPDGEVLYGVDLVVHPEFQDMGLAHHLYSARLQLASGHGCRGFAAGARMPGYRLAADRIDPQVYLDLVARGLIYDPTLSKLLRLGFRLVGLLPDYIRDPESGDCAALLFTET